MRYVITNTAVLAVMLIPHINIEAGDFCGSQCGDYCRADQCCTRCVPECKSVTVKKHCWQTECEEVCIPPVKLPCCKCLFGGKNNGCNNGCCDNSCGGCGNGCDSDCCKNSFLQRLFARCAGCRTRCVSKLKKHEYECEKNVIEWKCVKSGGCCDSSCTTGACCEPQCCAPFTPIPLGN